MSSRQRLYAAAAALVAVVYFVLSRLPDSVSGPALFASVAAFGWLLIGLPNSGAKRLESRQGQLLFGVLSAVGAVALILSALLSGTGWLLAPGAVLAGAAAMQAIRRAG